MNRHEVCKRRELNTFSTTAMLVGAILSNHVQHRYGFANLEQDRHMPADLLDQILNSLIA